MNLKIQPHHTAKPAYLYLRQSTMGQVRHHRESTERQYALKDKAQQLGWQTANIKTLDGDLGLSGIHATQREDFKTLVADVSMNKVGAVFALEASRLSRSCTDWHRLLELCALTDTLIIDEDGCYNPADFNDQLLLGLKGTMSQAELHFIRARLQGGKLNKAKKGELHFPLPVGFEYDAEGQIVFDSDEQVRSTVQLVFNSFHDTSSAYGVVQYFATHQLQFPKRAYGGVWNGQLIWGRLSHARVLAILRNPAYAGAYVYGRYRYEKSLAPDGTLRRQMKCQPQARWQVLIQDHHPAYLTWNAFLENQHILARNRTNATMLSGPAREGLALLQGLLICKTCGRKLSVRYTGNNGLYPSYQCTWRKREGLANHYCLALRCEPLDQAITRRVLENMKPEQLDIAIQAFETLEQRHQQIDQQWLLKIQRADYEAQLAQRRYEAVDPANRLVAATLEVRWNEALVKLDTLHQQYADDQKKHADTLNAEQKASLLALAKDFPRLWQAPSTQPKDRKRILRLLIKDITVERAQAQRNAILHIRWQGGAAESLSVPLPPKASDKWRCPKPMVDKISALATTLADEQIAAALNQQGEITSKGNPFTVASIKWIRYKHHIPAPTLKYPDELTVAEVAEKFQVSHYVVYYWIERGVIQARQLKRGAPYWITLTPEMEQKLFEWITQSSRIIHQHP